MQLSKGEVLALLRDRGNEPVALDADALLPDNIDVDRDRRILERLGVGRGDLLKHCGGGGRDD